MTIEKALQVGAPYPALDQDNKFDKRLCDLLMKRKDEEYSYEIFSDCFDIAEKTTKCQKCNRKGKNLYYTYMYCSKHLEDTLRTELEYANR